MFFSRTLDNRFMSFAPLQPRSGNTCLTQVQFKTLFIMQEKTFSFPASVQSDLFAYLKPHQQAILKPYLRIVKRPYQEKLCISLLDYLEGHGLETFSEPILAMLQEEIVQACNLHPITTREPKSIGTIIKQLFA